MRQRAVIFDLFETLMTEWGHEKYTKRAMCADLGLEWEAFDRYWEEQEQRRYLGEIDFAGSIRYVCEKCGKTVEESALAAVLEKRIATKSVCFLFVRPDVFGLLKELKARGLGTAIVSNCSADEVVGMRESALYSYFDQVVLSYEVGLQKPDGRIYRRAMELLGVAPEECLFVGDGGSHELEGAKSAGMKAVQAKWYTDQLPYRRESMPGFCVAEEPSEVLAFLD